MVTELVAGEVAEKGVVDFAQICEVATPDDVSKALEILISKAALAVEKYAGKDVAIQVLNRTALSMQTAEDPPEFQIQGAKSTPIIRTLD